MQRRPADLSKSENLAHQVTRHYGHDDLEVGVAAALAAHGSGPDGLGDFDELHVGGRDATRSLAEKLPLGEGRHLLDVGSGVGGAARLLAAERGWWVTGIDLTEPYCRVARDLTAQSGLAERAGFVVGNALSLPFADDTFQATTSVHAAMNIPDKAALYREIRRVLSPSGRFALYDLLQGLGGATRFPVPWADDEATSFLVGPEALRAHLEEAGFQILAFESRAVAGKAFYERAAKPSDLARAGVRLFLGADYKGKMANLKLNVLEERVVPWLVVCQA
ncbi:MAG: methyltransferase domain-containing protein [Pseudomonadota bacterium]